MSRCFPYPLPGYVKEEADKRLIESIKKEVEKSKKERRKEKKREKQEKKKRSRDGDLESADKKHSGEKRHKNESSHVNEHQDKVPEVVEHLEKSSVTEELCQPAKVICGDGSPDSTGSTQNVGYKRKRTDNFSPAVCLNVSNQGTSLRIRLALPKRKEPESSQKPCSPTTFKAAKDATLQTSLQGQLLPKESNYQRKPLRQNQRDSRPSCGPSGRTPAVVPQPGAIDERQTATKFVIEESAVSGVTYSTFSRAPGARPPCASSGRTAALVSPPAAKDQRPTAIKFATEERTLSGETCSTSGRAPCPRPSRATSGRTPVVGPQPGARDQTQTASKYVIEERAASGVTCSTSGNTSSRTPAVLPPPGTKDQRQTATKFVMPAVLRPPAAKDQGQSPTKFLIEEREVSGVTCSTSGTALGSRPSCATSSGTPAVLPLAAKDQRQTTILVGNEERTVSGVPCSTSGRAPQSGILSPPNAGYLIAQEAHHDCKHQSIDSLPLQYSEGQQILAKEDSHHRHRSRVQKMDLKYTELIVNWCPPPLQTELPDSDALDWLFERKQPCKQEAKKVEVSKDISWSTGLGAPRACYLPGADVHALPYALPF